jgi:hypothetical protein
MKPSAQHVSLFGMQQLLTNVLAVPLALTLFVSLNLKWSGTQSPYNLPAALVLLLHVSEQHGRFPPGQ